MNTTRTSARWDFASHLPLLVSGVAAFLVAIRILAVSGFHYETATVVLQTQGTASILLGSLLPVIAVVPVIAAIAVMMTFGLVDRKGGRRHFRMTLLFTTAVATVLIPWPVALLCLLATAPSFILAFLRRRRKTDIGRSPVREPSPLEDSRGLIIGMMLLFGTTAFFSDPWLPPEVIVYEDKETRKPAEIVGYLLTEREEEFVVLAHSPRRIEVVPRPSERSYCTIQRNTEGWIGDLSGWLARQESPVGLITYNDVPALCPVSKP